VTGQPVTEEEQRLAEVVALCLPGWPPTANLDVAREVARAVLAAGYRPARDVVPMGATVALLGASAHELAAGHRFKQSVRDLADHLRRQGIGQEGVGMAYAADQLDALLAGRAS